MNNYSIRTIAIDNNKKRDVIIESYNGNEYLLVGVGDAIMMVKIAEAKEVEMTAALGKDNWSKYGDIGKELAEQFGFIKSIKPDDDCTLSFEKVIDFLSNLPAIEFVSEIEYAKRHNNKFSSHHSILTKAVNADDHYCSVLIDICRKYDSIITDKVIGYICGDEHSLAEKVTVLNFIKSLVAE